MFPNLREECKISLSLHQWASNIASRLVAGGVVGPHPKDAVCR
jgi:hypothetical protein